MSKISLNDVTNINSVSTINENFTKIEQELQNKVLYRDNPVDEPNDVKSDIDFNGFDLLNVGVVHTASGDTWASSAEIFAIRDAVELDRIEVAANKDTVIAARDTTITNANTVASLYDQFDDRYLGAKASDPTLDNDGNTLVTGALYFNTSDPKQMKVYNGSAWQAVATFNTTTTTSIDSSLYANQTEAEQGLNNTKVLTSLRTAQAIAASTSVVHRTGDETIAGVKTFSSSPNGTYGKLLNIRKYTTPGTFTYTETAGTRWVEIVVVGGSGGGGYAAPSSAGFVQVIPCPGPGGYVKVRVNKSVNGATIVVGNGGNAATSHLNNGSDGGDSSFDVSDIGITAYGGLGGLKPQLSSTFPFEVANRDYAGFNTTFASSLLILDAAPTEDTFARYNYVESLTKATLMGPPSHRGTFGPDRIVTMSSGIDYRGYRADYFRPEEGATDYYTYQYGRAPRARVISGAFSGFADGFPGMRGCVIVYEYS